MAGIENHLYLLRRWLAQFYPQRMIEQFQISKAIGHMLVQKFTLIEAHGFHCRFRFKRVEQNRENEIRISANLNRPSTIRGQRRVVESRFPTQRPREDVFGEPEPGGPGITPMLRRGTLTETRLLTDPGRVILVSAASARLRDLKTLA
jgi:hypothetical protein